MPLTFSSIDGIAFAAARGRLDRIQKEPLLAADGLGPFVELTHLATDKLVPEIEKLDWLRLDALAAFWRALASPRKNWVSPQGGRLGFFKTAETQLESEWNAFSISAHKAALAAGFPSRIAAQLIAAFGEMRGNILEHSKAITSGLLAFRSQSGKFEFVVSDRGRGVLSSLKSCTQYANLADHGEALRMTLTDGVSRFGPSSNRGKGFRPLFIGLANLNGSLRFRSGDHALEIDGNAPTLMTARTGEKTNISGFLISVSCAKP